MELLDLENILLFHKKIVSKTGGSEGIRDLGLGVAEGNINENDIYEWIKTRK